VRRCVFHVFGNGPDQAEQERLSDALLIFPGIVSTIALSVQSKAILVFLVLILMQTSYGGSQFCPSRPHNRGQGLPSRLATLPVIRLTVSGFRTAVATADSPVRELSVDSSGDVRVFGLVPGGEFIASRATAGYYANNRGLTRKSRSKEVPWQSPLPKGDSPISRINGANR
jgi:hypothetical protein